MLFKDDRLLFFDDHAIESKENSTFTLNPPQKCGPCLVIEKDWELSVSRASSIVYWDGLYYLYYTIKLDEMHRALALATSPDGINWTRPEIGRMEFNGSKANNLVDIEGARPDETCVFIDPIAPDEHRFKLICHWPYKGMWLLTSPDGKSFKHTEGYLTQYATDNHMSVFYDPTISKYRIYCRGGDKERGIMGWKGSRVVVYGETDNLFKPLPLDENAPDPHERGMIRPGPDGKMIQPLAGINKELPKVLMMDEFDPPEADLYQAATVHYTPGAYVAFPTLYFHYPGVNEGGFHNDGVLDIQFASSRDGYNWLREPRGSYVRLDMAGGLASKQMHMLLGIVPDGNYLYQYYCGHKRSHGEGRTADNIKGIGFHEPKMGDPIAMRLSQRLDGFVSLDSAYTGGSVTTRPFTLNSDVLRINIDTSASGMAKAALLHEDGRPIEGFTVDDSDLVQGNDTMFTLKWGRNPDLSKLKGQKVKLEIRSRSAKLFAVYPSEPDKGAGGKK